MSIFASLFPFGTGGGTRGNFENGALLDELSVGVFRPLPPFLSGHSQTLAAFLLPQIPDIAPTSIHEIQLPDGDRIVLVENRPAAWKSGDRVVVLVHGLTGCHGSKYMVRLSRKLTLQGMLTLRMNLRGCGPGFGKAKLPYHSGRSEDTRHVAEWVSGKFPGSPVTFIGFSLGANITLKMAGEDGASPCGNLDSVVAVSPPVDLQASAEKICGKENRLYDRFFVKQLRREVARLAEADPELRCPEFPERMRLIDFDDLYTAPRGGFRNAREYYRRASSGPLLSSIRIPTLILCSEDDPVVDASALVRCERSQSIDLVLTRKGGHVGFLGLTDGGRGIRWMDSLILKWVRTKCSKS